MANKSPFPYEHYQTLAESQTVYYPAGQEPLARWTFQTIDKASTLLSTLLALPTPGMEILLVAPADWHLAPHNEPEELGNALVIGTQQLAVDITLYRSLADLHEAVLGEEVDFEGETENAPYSEPVCRSQQLVEDEMADSVALELRMLAARFFTSFDGFCPRGRAGKTHQNLYYK